MSSITPSNLAGSFAQTVAQQRHVSHAQDAQRNRAAENARAMRELLRKHIESVEDSYETTDDPMSVDKDGQQDTPQQQQQQQQQQQRPGPDEAGHLDIQA